MRKATLAIMAILMLASCQGRGKVTGADDGGGPESVGDTVGGNSDSPTG